MAIVKEKEGEGWKPRGRLHGGNRPGKCWAYIHRDNEKDRGKRNGRYNEGKGESLRYPHGGGGD